jgi:hypothetical protein
MGFKTRPLWVVVLYRLISLSRILFFFPTVLAAVYLYIYSKTPLAPHIHSFLHTLEEWLHVLVRIAPSQYLVYDTSSHPLSLDVFYGLTVVRVLSVVALLLAFSSSIFDIVSDVRAVNRSQHEPPSSDGACGYIGFAYLLIWFYSSADPVGFTFQRQHSSQSACGCLLGSRQPPFHHLSARLPALIRDLVADGFL